ncbi:DUF2690 domain-containing protein [Nocardia tengchongensis]|uniref:DUF2690 domain-containing protein n=1 Tax=Nocardia tengchongensis TaxID=2055889 RepID=UPI0036885FDA
MLAIVCGASAWPNADFSGSIAYANTAHGWREYLTDRCGMVVEEEDLLWLFDSLLDVSGHSASIADFISSRIEEGEFVHGAGLLIFLIYIGHGAFLGKRRDYCLPIRSTTSLPLPQQSSLHVADLAELLSRQAPSSSRVVILDCCFAGQAFKHFQSSVENLTKAKLELVLDQNRTTRRIALLCASSAHDPAQIDEDESYTLFGRAVLSVLREGDTAELSDMSLRRVCELARGRLESRGDDSPIPEVHSPDQTTGDLSSEAIFPNPRREDRVLSTASSGVLPVAARIAPPTRKRRRRAPIFLWMSLNRWYLVVASLVVLIATVAWVELPQLWSRDQVAQTGPRTGADPAMTPCVADSKVVAGTQNNPDFLVELIESPKCESFWARITRYGDSAPGNSVAVAIYRRDNPDGPERQNVSVPDSQSAITRMIHRQDPTDRLCATGSITIGPTTIGPSVPLCT